MPTTTTTKQQKQHAAAARLENIADTVKEIGDSLEIYHRFARNGHFPRPLDRRFKALERSYQRIFDRYGITFENYPSHMAVGDRIARLQHRVDRFFVLMNAYYSTHPKEHQKYMDYKNSSTNQHAGGFIMQPLSKPLTGPEIAKQTKRMLHYLEKPSVRLTLSNSEQKRLKSIRDVFTENPQSRTAHWRATVLHIGK